MATEQLTHSDAEKKSMLEEFDRAKVREGVSDVQ